MKYLGGCYLLRDINTVKSLGIIIQRTIESIFADMVWRSHCVSPNILYWFCNPIGLFLFNVFIDGLIAPGLSNIEVEAPSFAPRLRQSESSTSVIVIEWGESDSSITQPILYEVDYTLTPFQQPTMDTVKEFVSL